MNEPLGRRFRIESLAGTHDRADFTCGVPALDRYLANQAGQDAKKGYATVFVAVDVETSRIAAFYTLSMAGVAVHLLPESLKRKMPRYPSVPSVRLGRLAVASSRKGQGVGKWLLLDAMARSLLSEIAWAAFVVDAKDDVLGTRPTTAACRPQRRKRAIKTSSWPGFTTKSMRSWDSLSRNS